MKHILIAGLMVFTALPAWAQSSGEADAQSSSSASLQILSDTDATVYTDNSTTSYGDSGDGVADGVIRQRVETTGIANAPDFGSGHPCALGSSIAIGLVGSAASAGLSRVDSACMMVRSNDRRVQQAGWVLYASRDADACKALRSAGVISAASTCGENPEAAKTAGLVTTPIMTSKRPVARVSTSGAVTMDATR